jgi:16S rRNA (cytosine967-C5)-methyltransferase
MTPPATASAARATAPRKDPAREAAFDTLRAVSERDAYANLVLPGMLRQRSIAGRDAAFATELAYGTLRHRGTYDVVLAACSSRPLGQVDPRVLDLLRLGTHQILRSRVPARAAVSTTVQLARDSGSAGGAGFVNAVLRKVSTKTLQQWLELLAPNDPDEALGLELSHPVWIVRAFRQALGGDDGQLRDLLVADNVPAAVTLVARPGRCEVQELFDAGARPGRWSPYAAVLPAGDPGAIHAVREGRAGVQDEGSQLTTLALAQAPMTGPDQRWLDLCAGPGGKAALLDALAGQRGVELPTTLTAVELQAHRAGLVQEVVTARTAVVVADGTDPQFATGDQDRVLVDAPCTGLGALRRRPEARWRRQPADVAALGRTQRELLGAALAAVRPGGVVAYVTCSPHLAETRFVVADVLRRHDDAQPVDVRPSFPGVSDLGDGPFVQLWPHRHGTDAMFCALFRRTR